MISAAEARAHALSVIQRKLDRGFLRCQVEAIIFEGASGWKDDPGYEIRGDRISVPWLPREGAHEFRISELLDEIELGQGDMFA